MKKRLRNRKHEARMYVFNYLRSYDPGQVRVVIFGQGRSGSTLLESLMCSTDHFEGNGELLNSNRRGEVVFPLPFVKGFAKWKADRNVVFHVKIYQLTRDRRRPVDPAFFLRSLYDEGWKVIHLRRENPVKLALSNIVAEHRGVAHKYDDRPEVEKKLTVDCDRLVRMVSDRIRFVKEEKAALAGIDYHPVEYERDLENEEMHQPTIDGILDFLGLDGRVATTRLRKINTKKMSDFVSNYEEFAACITANDWEAYLD